LLTGNVTQTILFGDLFDKPLVALFDRSHASSDGGAVLLAAADRRLGLLDRLAACLEDRRQPGKIRHDLQSLLAQRVHALACGYPDGNDAAQLAADPVLKLLAGHDPVGEELLASQPTLSRFENAVGPRELFRMAEALADTVIERHRRRRKGRARRITVDLDITDDPTHGAQQLTFFNGFYDTWCYLPLVGFITFDREPEQHLVAAVLRPGNAGRQLAVLGVLRRLVDRLHRAFPKARILVRLDSGFVFPQLFDYLDSRPRLDYVVAYARNSVLERAAAHDRRLARLACWANQFRVLLTATAYLLFQEIRFHARRTTLARAQVATLRDMLLKLGAEVERSVRRFVVHLPATAPYRDVWQRIAIGLGAQAG
jgi:hypothetical protein